MEAGWGGEGEVKRLRLTDDINQKDDGQMELGVGEDRKDEQNEKKPKQIISTWVIGRGNHIEDDDKLRQQECEINKNMISGILS